MKPDEQSSQERIKHTLKAILDIQTFTQGITYEDFKNDLKAYYACLYQFAVIGEAVVHMDSGSRLKKRTFVKIYFKEYPMTYDYNSSRKKLILPEYGRNIQKMVNHIKTIEDRDERNKAAQTVIGVMGNLNPHLRDVNDFKHKLWDHLAIIADFDLDIDSPYPWPERESLQSNPDTVPYHQHKIRKKHYGRSIVLMIEKAVALEAGEEKDDLVKMIAYHMKKSYLTWNREAVSDSEIFGDMKTLSGGVLEVNPDLKLPETKDILAKNHPINPKKKGGGKKGKHHHQQKYHQQKQ